MRTLLTLLTLLLLSYPCFADDLITVQGDFETPVINELCKMPQPDHGLAYIVINGKCVAILR